MLLRLLLLFSFVLCSSAIAKADSSQQQILAAVDKLEALNEHLIQERDEEVISALLEQQADQLERLLRQLRTTTLARLPSAIDVKRQNLLESRMAINQERGNKIAVLRDMAELETAKTRQAVRSYLEFLIQASANYVGIDEIVAASQRLLEKSRQRAETLKLPAVPVEGQIFAAFEHNQQQFTLVNTTFQDILKYVVNNPRQIASTHWFQEFSLLSIISYINHFDVLRGINHKLIPFKIDVGGVSVSLAIILLVYFSYPFLFKFTSSFIKKYVIDEEVDLQTQIYHEIRKPARALLIFFGIDLATYAFFYKTDYRPSIENITFVIYSLIIVWLMFKILDTVVLVQVRKISQNNTELRKELINLGVQTGKVLILVVVLAIGLNHFGISITAIMSTLGIGGLAFALAAKDTLSNLFGGITILFDNVFRMGDWVKIGDVEGTVAEIGLRSTTIRTFDNALITIPNAQVSVSSVMNWNRRVVGRRIKMHIAVTYESNMDDIRNALNDLREMLKSHPGIANPKQKLASGHRHFKLSSLEDVKGIKATQLVFMDRYNDSSIDILIYCFSKTVNWAEWLAVKEDVMFKIAEILRKNHLEFAYPTQVRIHRAEMKAPA
ncbi:mechanosensitive ion channel domain-containing protein [Methylomarinum vadi]|uniref:mechanosensitive ion channel domain-containing protein n=1 Tax=Methylomarinum vadi TaxID=438855 RepID=UPI00068C2FD9|nr:mechanosensitive ion channel domain-containing protein [Methylomarinum vadi]